MAVHELTLSNIEHLDGGRLELAFREALTRAAQDCDDRPGDIKPRVVTLAAELIPVMDGGGMSSVNVTFKVVDKIPPRVTKPYDMSFRRGGKLAFNDLARDDVNQKTIDQVPNYQDDEE